METEYQVKTGDFEGPLHLLLELVEKRKLFINELSLSEVADDYLDRVRAMEGLPIEEVTGFLVVASTLVMIKSRSLIPQTPITDEEEAEIDDLERRLKLYQHIKDQTKLIKNNFGKKRLSFGAYKIKDTIVFAPDQAITIDNLNSLLQELIKTVPTKTQKHPEASVAKTITLQEAFDNLEERINRGIFSFQKMCQSNSKVSKEQKIYVVVNFLALLEMMKKGIINAVQNDHFEDIVISKNEIYDNHS